MEYVLFLKILVTDPCCDLTVVPMENQWQCEELGANMVGRLMGHANQLEWQCVFIPKVRPADD